jgi:hypothetical protein
MTPQEIDLRQGATAFSVPGGYAGSVKPSRDRVFLALVLLVSALYMARELKRGWVPPDEGTLAESADRVLRGELPHRDYHEAYTGGLAYVNAAAFRVFGTNLASMRYMLFLFFLAWVPAVYYAASRFVSPPVASAVTLLAVAWGPPNYAAAMPSWYNLFFATFGLAALLRYIQIQTGRWLLIAGFCGGISFLFKLLGLYFVAGALLFLLFRKQLSPSAAPADRRERVWYRGFLLTSMLLYEALVFGLLRHLANAATYLYYWVPNLAVGATIVWQEFHASQNRSRRFSFFLRESALFGIGFAAPITVFLIPYWLTGSLSAVVRDLITIPGRLIVFAGAKPTLFALVLGSVADLVVIAAVLSIRSINPRHFWKQILLGVPIAALIWAALLLARQAPGFYMVVWNAVWALAPFIVVLGVGLLVRWSMFNRLEVMQRQRLFITLSVTAACGLLQFPFRNIYFCYIAPLVLLSATAVVSLMERPPRLAVSGMMCFFFLYAVFELTPGFVYHLAYEYAPDIQTVRLSLPRGGGLRVSAATAREYEELDSLIRQHARGEYILAKPDCPEVYFLSGFRDPSDIFHDFYEDASGRTQRALAAIELHKINLVVLNHLSAEPIPDDLKTALERDFPNRADAGDFEVRWKP